MLEHLTGLLTGLVGFGLAATGLVLGLLASIRMLWVVRRPGKGRIARGIAVAGLVLFLCGALLFTVQEVDTPLRAASDRSAQYLAAVVVLLAVYAGSRSARRRPATKPAVRAEPVEPAAQQGTATSEPPQASRS